MDLNMLTYESEWTMKKIDNIMKYLEEFQIKIEELSGQFSMSALRFGSGAASESRSSWAIANACYSSGRGAGTFFR